MAKSKYRQLAIVRRLKGPRKARTQIGVRVPLLFLAIIIIAMTLDMCAFPVSQRNVVLAQACHVLPSTDSAQEPVPVEKRGTCQ